jgi:DNA repair protein RadA/Sms
MSKLQIQKRRGRPATKQAKQPLPAFDASTVYLIKGSELSFDKSLFDPMLINLHLDSILSTDGGLMPATSMVICGGPGSGKSTVVLDMLAQLTKEGKKCLFISGEMDEIHHYKYCKRMPQFARVQTLFLKNYSHVVKETLEHVFNMGFDVIAIDSIAEVIDMYKDAYRTTESAAEGWFLALQSHHKKGNNKAKKYTAFINIQQVTKAGEFAGSNRLKHMTDAMCHVERIKDSDSRKLYFSKNRDNDTNTSIEFRIGMNRVEYMFTELEAED